MHFALKKQRRSAPRVMPLEALWSFGPSSPPGVLAPVVASTPAASDRRRWRWQAMIAQTEPVTAEDVAAAVAGQRAAHPEVAAVRYLRWREGLAAQILRVGPYAAEAPSFVRLHGDLRAAGYRPRGRHHEIYLGDPRRSAAERLRTVLRQPVELAGDA